jgi:hypothetical protein
MAPRFMRAELVRYSEAILKVVNLCGNPDTTTRLALQRVDWRVSFTG